ncbi:MAG: DEAD/DEAH box helicase family protein, partial [Thermoanaerobaculia bacterium]
MDRFQLVSNLTPQGDQPEAIRQLVTGIEKGLEEQVLVGVTGSGKTFTIAKVVEEINRPTLVLSHNKTLAAQLFQEFRSFFPHNAVEYFVSYYDYYQPEAYVPQTDTYIEKETSINEEIDRLRLRATKVLFERRDVLIVASVSCIYGLGSPESFFGMLHFFDVGDDSGMDRALRALVDMQYERTQMDLYPGSFRARGDVLEVFPAYEQTGIRVAYFGDEIESICRFDILRGDALEEAERIAVFPKTHYVTTRERLESAVATIPKELSGRLDELEQQEKLLERQRLEQRTRFDLEMLREVGYCHG